MYVSRFVISVAVSLVLFSCKPSTVQNEESDAKYTTTGNNSNFVYTIELTDLRSDPNRFYCAYEYRNGSVIRLNKFAHKSTSTGLVGAYQATKSQENVAMMAAQSVASILGGLGSGLAHMGDVFPGVVSIRKALEMTSPTTRNVVSVKDYEKIKTVLRSAGNTEQDCPSR